MIDTTDAAFLTPIVELMQLPQVFGLTPKMGITDECKPIVPIAVIDFKPSINILRDVIVYLLPGVLLRNPVALGFQYIEERPQFGRLCLEFVAQFSKGHPLMQ